VKIAPPLQVRARTHEGLMAATLRTTETIKRSQSSDRVLVVYDDKSARVYIEPRASAPRYPGRS
jgi:hypothetical protein